MTDQSNGTAITVREPRGAAIKPFDPVTELDSIMRLSEALMGSKGFVPGHLKTPGEIAAVIIAGRELGLPAMVALRNLYVIEGKVGLDAAAQLGLMAKAGITWKWLSQGEGGYAELEITRPGMAPHRQKYTIEDARTAGLANKNNWKNHPKAMLRARCVSAAGKTIAPDVLAGVYSLDEVEEIAERAGRPIQIDVSTGEVTRLPETGTGNGSTSVARLALQDAGMVQTMEDQSRRRNESEAIAVKWISEDLPTLTTREAIVAWAYRNGHEMTALHPTPQGRVWTALKNAAKRAGVKNTEVREWLRAAPAAMDQDDGDDGRDPDAATPGDEGREEFVE